MQTGQFKVPLIQQDVSHEETALQLALALDSLQAIVESVFTSVEGGLKKGRLRLQDLQRRCENAKEKVQRIKGITKSITVYSSAKYPVPHQNLFFEDLKLSKVQIEEPQITIKHTPLPPNKLSLKEKMKFYHVKDSTQLLRKNEEVTPFEGLGTMPANLKSICSLLLFNTSENIYDNYKIIDPLAVPQQSSLNTAQESKPELEPAPASLISAEPLGLKNIPNYFYTPILQDAPEIHVPLDLPYLSGIAGDLRYDEDFDIQRLTKDNIPENSRPEITEDKITLVQELPKLEERIPTETLLPPPPPPPPPPPLSEPELTVVEVVSQEQGQKTKITISEPDSSSQPLQRPPQPSVVPDMRANLMEAIRQAGGKPKLKATPVEQKNVSKKAGGMSLMEDLHDKLLMRRKGILGKSDAAEGNILEHVATMIPPPPTKQQESEEEDDPEWDD